MAFFRHRWLEICLYQCRRPSELFGGEAMMRAGWLVNILRFRPVLARAYNATIRRWLAHLFSAFAACFLIACGNDPPKPPASYPFPVFKKETTLNQQIQIVEHRAYVIELKFHSPDGKDIPKLRSLLTGGNYSVDKKYLGTGVPIPLKVAIFRSTQAVLRLASVLSVGTAPTSTGESDR